MRRRDFVQGIVISFAWPLAARAQDRVRRVGVLVPLRATDPIFQRNMTAFTTAMKNAGWIEGRNLDIRIVSIIGSGKSPTDAAADLLALSPDVVVAVAPMAAEAVHRQTSTVPVVFVVGWFSPIEEGFVGAISHPGGNMTGITDLEPSLGGKWLQLLKQVAPEITRAGVFYNPNEGTIPSALLQGLQESAPRIGIGLIDLPIRDETQIENVIATFGDDQKGGLIFPTDVFTAAHRARIIAAANSHRIPTVFPFRYMAVDGGLLAYSPNQPNEFGQVAYFVDRILCGNKPGSLPVQTPTKYELVINLKTANALGLAIPASMLSVADELID
jgi:putative tryptophan/tyrosine transport system substrate-binding protein